MTIIVITSCPPKLRGDLSKWFFEINCGVYVGNVTARVRAEIWDRICINLKNGQATKVYPAAGEQRLAFQVHNTSWQPLDFDGVTLMSHPGGKITSEAEEQSNGNFPRTRGGDPTFSPISSLKPGFSKAAKRKRYGHRK